MEHALLLRMLSGQAGVRETLLSDQLSVDGSVLDLVAFFALFDAPDAGFPIVTP